MTGKAGEGAGAGFLPYAIQSIDEDDIEAVAAVLRSDYLTTGPEVAAFEADLCAATGARHAVVCANGTAALHLAVDAAGVGPGDVVIVPAVTFVATANAARYCGARVVLADVDPDTGLLTSETLARAIHAAGGPIKAVIPVHLAGQSADMPGLSELAWEEGAQVIEDASHALGTVCTEGRVGACSFSDAATFSFHPVKTITSGEGGVVVTQNPLFAARARNMRSHGISRDPAGFQALAPGDQPGPWYYEAQALGWNYRLPDVNCALGRSQLRRLARFVDRRAALIARYDALLAPLAPLVRAMPRQGGQRASWHLSVALIDFAGAGRDRASVMGALRDRGIGTQVHYIPLHLHPLYRSATPLPGADAYYARALSLPLFPAMADADVDRVVDALAAVLGR